MQQNIIENPHVYVRFERKTQPADYESASASVSIPIPLTEADAGRIALEMSNAQSQVYGALGLDGGAEVAAAPQQATAPAPTMQQAVQNVGQAFPGTQAATPPPPARQPVPPAPTPQSGYAAPVEVPCGICGGQTWDNRENKRNPRGPDFKCKDRDACGAAAWLDEDGLIGEWRP